VPGPVKNLAAVSFVDFRTDRFPHPGHIPRIARRYSICLFLKSPRGVSLNSLGVSGEDMVALDEFDHIHIC
jgi:hypothetical protein